MTSHGMRDGSAHFTVVIPNRGRVDSLVRAIKSVRRADEGAKIIVVDDASENFQSIKERLNVEFRNTVTLIGLESRSGGAIARNVGIQNADTEWIALLDSDDEFMEGKFEHVRQFLRRMPDASFVYHRAVVRIDGIDVRVLPTRPLFPDESVGNFIFVSGQGIPTCNIVAKRTLLARCPFRPALRRHQDLQLCVDLERDGATFHFIPSILSVINWSLGSRPTSKGESAYYSQEWQRANAHAFSEEARRSFSFQFVVRKLLEEGRLREATSVAIREKAIRSMSQFVIFCGLVVLPKRVTHALYSFYKLRWQRHRAVRSSTVDENLPRTR